MSAWITSAAVAAAAIAWAVAITHAWRRPRTEIDHPTDGPNPWEHECKAGAR